MLQGQFLSPSLASGATMGLYDDNKALYGKVYFYYLWELPIYAAMGIFGGCMGVLFIKLNIRVSRLRGRFIPVSKRGRRIAEVETSSLIATHSYWLALERPLHLSSSHCWCMHGQKDIEHLSVPGLATEGLWASSMGASLPKS